MLFTYYYGMFWLEYIHSVPKQFISKFFYMYCIMKPLNIRIL